MYPMIIGYTNWELYHRFDKLRGKLGTLEPGSEEYNMVRGELNRVSMLDDALTAWIDAHRGCWFCWDDMDVVEEDRESFKGQGGYEERFLEGFDDSENHYSGVPKIMSQPAKIKRTEVPTDNFDPALPREYHYYTKHDIVLSDDESVVLVKDVERCPYCGRDLKVEWGKKYRNIDKFWGVDDYSFDYSWDDIDSTPWEDDDDL